MKFQTLIFYWLPPILWMTLIFALSSRTHVVISDNDITNFLFFKSLHMIEYAALYLLWFRAFRTKQIPPIFAVLISILYAISDEIHQAFIPTREGTIRDVLIDTLGIYIMHFYAKKRF